MNVNAMPRDVAIGLSALVAALIVPFLWPTRYVLEELTLFCIWATVVTQWNLVFGLAGVFSLAQLAIFAVGGYVTGMLGLYLGWSLWLAMFGGGLAAVAFSVLVGLGCLRLRGAYVALLTLAVSQTMYLLIITDVECFYMEGVTCRNFTGGTRGLTKYGDFGFRDLLAYKYVAFGDYFLALLVLTAATVFSVFIFRSPLGLAFQALRDNAAYAVSRGISRFKSQLLVFSASALFTGLAGAVYAGHFRVMGANTLYLSLMLFLLSMMIVGGVGRAWGPLLGAAALMIVDEVLRQFVEWRLLGLGLMLILFVVLWPNGLAGAIEALARRFARSLPHPIGVSPPDLAAARESSTPHQP
jgi:branched-chain amino acid transport system permease protein